MDYLNKNKERIQKFKETGDSRYIYQNELDNACFPHDMAYGDFKDLARRTVSDKILHDKAFNIAKRSELLLHCFTNSYDQKYSGSAIEKHMSDQQLAKELLKPIIRKFKKKEVQSPCIGNTSGAVLATRQLIIKFNKGFRFWLCVISIYSKYEWVIPLKDKKGITITKAFQKILK